MIEPPVWIHLKDLAEMLGRDQRVIARSIAEGKGPGIKVGGVYLISEAAVQRWLRGESGFWDAAISGGVTAEPIPVELPPYLRAIQ